MIILNNVSSNADHIKPSLVIGFREKPSTVPETFCGNKYYLRYLKRFDVVHCLAGPHSDMAHMPCGTKQARLF